MPEEKQYKGKERFKGYNSGDKAVREGVDTTYDGLDDNLKSFVDKLSEKFGEGEIVFTSGYRDEEGESNHFHGNAVDMRPNPKVWNYLVNEEEGINLMVEHGLNILDESDPKKLKGNAPHFHVSTGKYSNAVHSTDRYEKIGTDKFEALRPFVEVYAEHTGTVYDYSQPVAYDPEKMKYVSENVYKDNYSPTSTGTISMTHYEGDGHDHGQEGAADNINEINERLLKELEILRKERESSEAEAELEAEEQEYLNAQQTELNRRNQMVQREQQIISEREQARPVGQIAPQPQQTQPHPAQAFSGQISTPEFIYSLENNLPPLPEFSDGGWFPSWMNYKNWGVTDYSDKGDFNTAYSTARKSGEKEFLFRGKRYNTNYEGTPQQQLKETGITDNQLHNRSRFEKNMSNNLSPIGYSPALNGFNKAIFGEKSVERKQLEDSGIENKRLDAFYLYTGVPQKNNTFSISNYRPSKSKDENAIYYSIRNNKTIDYILEEGLYKDGKINIAGNQKSKHILNDGLDNVMGNYTLSTGKDDRGEYISYYDKWDLTPIDFGKPFEIYDRIYIKDYGDGKQRRMYYTDKELSELDIDKKDFDTLGLQRELSNRGYKLPKSTKQGGGLDGIWGDETKNALLEYRKSQKDRIK